MKLTPPSFRVPSWGSPLRRSLPCLCLIGAIAALGSASPVQAAELLAYFEFNDAADPGSTTDTFAAHEGTLINGAAYSADGEGRTGQAGDRAMDFGLDAAAQAVQVLDATFLNDASAVDAITITFWQKNASTESSSSFWGVSPTSTGTSRGIQAHVPWGNGTIFFDHAGCCDPPQRLSGAPAPTHDWLEWHHYVFLKAGDRKEIWIDGEMILSGTGAAPLPTDFTEFYIGSTSDGASMQGVIDDFAIFAGALLGAEIQLLAEGGSALDLVDDTDTDGDGMLDVWEDQYGLDKNDASDAQLDKDSDGLNNLGEFTRKTDPTNPDTDNDGLQDGVETGTGTWAGPSNTGTNPLNRDTDGDSLPDGLENPDLPYVDENQPGTSPLNPDSDGDTFDDAVELAAGSDPTNPNSVPAVPGEVNLLAYFEFNDPVPAETTVDSVGGRIGELMGGAAFTASGGGRSGAAGDYGMDFGPDVAGQTVLIADGSFLNIAAAFDTITFAFWQKNAATQSSSTFWAVSPSSTGNRRGVQAHVPWGNGTIYYDHAGCCNGPQRLDGPPPVDHDFLVWNHYVFLKDGERKEVWINGVLALEDFDLAAPLPTDFTELYLGSEFGNNSLQAVLDDFAVFASALDEEQIAVLAEGGSAFDLTTPPAPFQITSIVYDKAAGQVTLEWNSRPGRLYAVDVATVPGQWVELDDAVESEGAETSYVDPSVPEGAENRFYQVRIAE